MKGEGGSEQPRREIMQGDFFPFSWRIDSCLDRSGA